MREGFIELPQERHDLMKEKSLNSKIPAIFTVTHPHSERTSIKKRLYEHIKLHEGGNSACASAVFRRNTERRREDGFLIFRRGKK